METGQKVTHLIEEGGRFAQACATLLSLHPAILYHDRAGDDEEGRKARKKKAASKTKYTCEGCGTNAWAKPAVNLWCGDEHGWIGFDPTNAVIAAQNHIVLAVGRDYSDVAPIGGVVLGSGGQKIEVAVDVTPAE